MNVLAYRYHIRSRKKNPWRRFDVGRHVAGVGGPELGQGHTNSRFFFDMGPPLPVRWVLFIETGPWIFQ